MFVAQSMIDAVGLIEARGNDVHILGVARVVAPKNGVRDMIGQLHKTGGARVDKERRIGDILQRPPSRSNLAKLAAQSLQ